MTSQVRAIEQARSPNFVRCMRISTLGFPQGTESCYGDPTPFLQGTDDATNRRNHGHDTNRTDRPRRPRTPRDGPGAGAAAVIDPSPPRLRRPGRHPPRDPDLV